MGKMIIIEGNSNEKDNMRVYMVKGERGDDGVSPTFETEKVGDTATITITDVEGTHTVELKDGVSPTVETSKTDKTTTIEITDIDGTKTAEIKDGVDLTGGVPTNGIIGFESNEIIYICDGSEIGTYYLTYNNTDYYFTMPEVEDGDVLTFNTKDLTLKLGNTTIVTSSSGTGTLIVFVDNIPDGFEEIGTNNVITVGGTSSITISTDGDNTIPITQVLEQVGDKFTISNNKVYVGAGISKVKVSASVYANLSSNRTANAFNFYIRKNGGSISGKTTNGYSSGQNVCLSLAPKLVSVNKNDYIDYYVYAYNGDVIRNENNGTTFLTIEAVD